MSYGVWGLKTLSIPKWIRSKSNLVIRPTPLQNHGSVRSRSILLLRFVCEQSSRQTDAPILMQFSLNSWFPHWLGLGDLGSKVKVTVT